MAILVFRNYPSVLDEVQNIVDRPSSFTQFSPSMNMVEDKDELIINVDLPGVKKEDVDITIDGNMLNIKAEKKSPEFSEEAKYYTCERDFGSYSRSLELPFGIDTDKVSTQFENGVLEIRLPRSEESKPRHISITGSKKQLRERAEIK